MDQKLVDAMHEVERLGKELDDAKHKVSSLLNLEPREKRTYTKRTKEEAASSETAPVVAAAAPKTAPAPQSVAPALARPLQAAATAQSVRPSS